MEVIKRDGRHVQFDKQKIINALNSAFKECNENIDDYPNLMKTIDSRLYGIDSISVEKIQDIVEESLIYNNASKVAKAYILYRDHRSKARDASKNLTKTFKDIILTDAKNVDLKRENANIDTNAPMGMMLKFGTESAKDFNLNYLIKPEIAQAHKNGEIHIHKLNCGLI